MSDTRSGRFYFLGERALFLGTGLPASVHAHHALQICIPLSGTIRLRPGKGAPWRSYAGAMIPSNQPHESDVAVPRLASLWLEPRGTAGSSMMLGGKASRIVPIAPSQLEQIVPGLIDCWERGADAQQAATILEEVVRILGRGRRSVPAIDPRMARVLEVLAATPDRRLPLAEIAASVSLSPSRVAHLFSETVGIPPRRYLLWLRLRDAVCELTAGASITDAAHAAGFADAPHLDRTFRRMLGFTPSAALRAGKFVQDAPSRRC